jgi:hypothetical protein
MSLTFVALRFDVRSFGPFLACGLIALAIAEPAMRPASKHHAEVLYWGMLLELALSLAQLLQFREKAVDGAIVYWMLVCMGLTGIGFGVLRLRRFVRENPKPAETEA